MWTEWMQKKFKIFCTQLWKWEKYWFWIKFQVVIEWGMGMVDMWKLDDMNFFMCVCMCIGFVISFWRMYYAFFSTKGFQLKWGGKNVFRIEVRDEIFCIFVVVVPFSVSHYFTHYFIS